MGNNAANASTYQQVLDNAQGAISQNAGYRQQSYNNYANAYNTGVNVADTIYNNAGVYANAAGNWTGQQADLYNSALNSQANIAQQILSNSLTGNSNNLSAMQAYLNSSTMPISTAAALQEALLQAPLAIYDASLGLSGNNNQALTALRNTGTTTQTTSGGGGFWSGLLGNALGGVTSGLVGKLF